MTRHLLLPSLAALAAALVLPSAGVAQTTPAQPAPGYVPAAPSDADALATQMRIVAAQPTDVGALTLAGELSARVGDLSGAASLFARADKVDPHNGRVKAGMAEVLLRSERPGEALRFFDQAEGYGYPPARFAAERGLAYDLLGQQGRAQRDYRLVLAAGDNAEVRRRYALSLAISGQNEAALQQLEPLIRRNDRGAWRSRAFILAMSGDAAGAGSIATTMMAPGQAQGLAPFFARLSSLGPVDRAFAVHFGELRPTPQRIADARLAPALPPLAPEVVQVARPVPVAAPAPVKTADRRRRRKGEVEVAAVTPRPTPAPLPPAYGVAARPTAAPIALAATTPAPAPTAVTTTPATAPRRTALAAGTPSRGVPFYYPGSMLPHYLPRPAPAVPAAIPAAGIASSATRTAVAPLPAQQLAAPRSAPAPVAAPVPAAPTQLAAAATPTAGFSSALVGTGPSAASTTSVPAPVAVASAPSTAAAVPSATPPAQPAARTSPDAAGDAVLARIADALAIPGRELAAAGAAPPAAPPEREVAAATAPARPLSSDFPSEPMVVNGQLTAAGRAATSRRRRPVEVAAAPSAPATPDTAPPEPATSRRGRRAADVASTAAPEPNAGSETTTTRRGRRALAAAAPADPAQTDSASDRPTTRRGRRELAAADTAEPTPTTARTRRGAHAADDTATDEPATTDRKATARQAAADRKAAADKKAAAEKKAVADKEAAEERRAKKAEPERYWVQVAGGANEGDLPKAWSAMKAKAPALAGHKGYTTPLRATNRVVTGPFKTDEEARAFVNTLKKQGVSAFQFTSEAGQKVSRLDGK